MVDEINIQQRYRLFIKIEDILSRLEDVWKTNAFSESQVPSVEYKLIMCNICISSSFVN